MEVVPVRGGGILEVLEQGRSGTRERRRAEVHLKRPVREREVTDLDDFAVRMRRVGLLDCSRGRCRSWRILDGVRRGGRPMEAGSGVFVRGLEDAGFQPSRQGGFNIRPGAGGLDATGPSQLSRDALRAVGEFQGLPDQARSRIQDDQLRRAGPEEDQFVIEREGADAHGNWCSGASYSSGLGGRCPPFQSGGPSGDVPARSFCEKPSRSSPGAT